MLVKLKLLNESASNKTTFWKARSVEEEHSSINTTRGNMVHFPRTPQQMSLPAVASEAETMATPQLNKPLALILGLNLQLPYHWY